MEMSLRQKGLLEKIVEEYIETARPVSSQLLEKKYKFDVCPATIRNEMQTLTKEGYLFQPYTSAGRAPTDKGYRFFVDGLSEKEFRGKEINTKIANLIEKEWEDTFKLVQSLTKNLAILSSGLALGYLCQEKILWKEGWKEVLEEPEFQEHNLISDFFKLLKSLEERIEEFEINSEVRIFIGKESPLYKAKDFSIIISRCCFPSKKDGVLAISGPKRMAYQTNISLIDSIVKILERY